MKTQAQHFYSSHNQLAEKNKLFDWLSKIENPITPAELEKLKQKNIKVWSGFKLTGGN